MNKEYYMPHKKTTIWTVALNLGKALGSFKISRECREERLIENESEVFSRGLKHTGTTVNSESAPLTSNSVEPSE